jgi:hypothetical protein
VHTATAEKIAECPESNTDREASLVRQVETITRRRDRRDRDSLAEDFKNELEAWARHSLAANGFGDY